MFALVIKKMIELIMSMIISLNANQAKTTTTEKVKEKPVTTTTQTIKKEPVQKNVQANRIPSHIYIGNIDVEVVYIEPTSTYDLQVIVDHPNKAASYKYGKCLYIGDHSDQAFYTLPNVKVGDYAYWQNKRYKCYYADDNCYLDQTGHIRLSNNKLLCDFECTALVTCKTDYTRYVRLFKEE